MVISTEKQRRGCPDHVLIPHLLEKHRLDIVDPDEENVTKYFSIEGETLKNGRPHLSSKELLDKVFDLIQLYP